MGMTLSQMQEFVRTHADADVEDAPNSSLEVYGRIAYNDILSRRTGWPHLTVAYTVTTTPGVQEYPMSAFSTTDMDSVFSVVDTQNLGRRLIYMTQADADIAFGLPANTTSDIASAWTVVGSDLVIYPMPATSRTYQVRGVRAAASWPDGAGSQPDLPAPLHEAICWYMLSSYFMAQEDTQLAGVYLNEYEKMVDRFVKNETTKEHGARVKVIGGQNYREPSFTRWVRGNLEG